LKVVRKQNEGSFGCEAVASALGQPNVPECGQDFRFLSCLYAAKLSLSFYSLPLTPRRQPQCGVYLFLSLLTSNICRFG